MDNVLGITWNHKRNTQKERIKKYRLTPFDPILTSSNLTFFVRENSRQNLNTLISVHIKLRNFIPVRYPLINPASPRKALPMDYFCYSEK